GKLRSDLRIANAEVFARRIDHSKAARIGLEGAVRRYDDSDVFDAVAVEVSSKYRKSLRENKLRSELGGDNRLYIVCQGTFGRRIRKQCHAKAQDSNRNRNSLHEPTLSLDQGFSSAECESPKPLSSSAIDFASHFEIS